MGIGQLLRLSQTERLERPYAQSPVIYACVQAIANAQGTAPMRIYESDAEDAEDVGPDDPLRLLLKRPNPLMGLRKLRRAMSMFYNLAGGTFLFMNGRSGEEMKPIREGEFPLEIWPVREDLVEPEIDMRTLMPTGWRINWAGKTIVYPDHAVAHIYEHNPHDPLRGWGPLQSCWRSADHIFRAEAFDDGLVENGGQIGGFFSHEERRLSGKPLETMQRTVDQNVSAPKNDRKKLVLPADMKFTPTAFSPVDMQAQEMRLMKRNEIMAAFGVTPTILGITEDVNRANSQAVRRVFYENKIGPDLEFVSEEMNAQFLIKLPPQFHGYWIAFDLSKAPAMREDRDAEMGRVRMWMGMGRSFNEAVEIEELDIDTEGMEGADDRYRETGLTPISGEEADRLAEQFEAGIAAKPAPGEDEEKPGKPKPEKSLRHETRSTRAQREAALEVEEKRLARSDKRMRNAIRRVFDDYIVAQRKRVKQVAASVSGSIAASIRPWSEYTDSGLWKESAHQYAALMDMTPALGEEAWYEVKNISEDELLQLLLANEEEWGRALWGAVKGPLLGAMEEAAQAVAIGRVQISAYNPAIIQYLAAKEVRLVEGPMSVVAEQVKRALVRGMADASSVGTLADRVREALESVEDQLRALQDRLGTRASMIARTESGAAANYARVEQYHTDGIAQIEWLSAGDDLVREGHQIDGERTIVGEPFSNGMRHPGDPNAPVGLTANCRCTVTAVIPEASEAASLSLEQVEA